MLVVLLGRRVGMSHSVQSESSVVSSTGGWLCTAEDVAALVGNGLVVRMRPLELELAGCCVCSWLRCVGRSGIYGTIVGGGVGGGVEADMSKSSMTMWNFCLAVMLARIAQSWALWLMLFSRSFSGR